MLTIRKHAFARAGLIGNPSDGYHGRTIALSVPNFAARVVLYEWDEVESLVAQAKGSLGEGGLWPGDALKLRWLEAEQDLRADAQDAEALEGLAHVCAEASAMEVTEGMARSMLRRTSFS